MSDTWVNELVGWLFECMRSIKAVPEQYRTNDDRKLHELTSELLMHIFDMFGGVTK
jgi:hypothetical protein